MNNKCAREKDSCFNEQTYGRLIDQSINQSSIDDVNDDIERLT